MPSHASLPVARTRVASHPLIPEPVTVIAWRRGSELLSTAWLPAGPRTHSVLIGGRRRRLHPPSLPLKVEEGTRGMRAASGSQRRQRWTLPRSPPTEFPPAPRFEPGETQFGFPVWISALQTARWFVAAAQDPDGHGVSGWGGAWGAASIRALAQGCAWAPAPMGGHPCGPG